MSASISNARSPPRKQGDNGSTLVVSEAKAESGPIGPVLATEGNPLTDWLYEAGYGIGHHFLADILHLPQVTPADAPEYWDVRMWDDCTWQELLDAFDVDTYVSPGGADRGGICHLHPGTKQRFLFCLQRGYMIRLCGRQVL